MTSWQALVGNFPGRQLGLREIMRNKESAHVQTLGEFRPRLSFPSVMLWHSLPVSGVTRLQTRSTHHAFRAAYHAACLWKWYGNHGNETDSIASYRIAT